MQHRTMYLLRSLIVCVAIVCELCLSDTSMVIFLAVAGIAGRALVVYQQCKVEREARQEGIHHGITTVRQMLAYRVASLRDSMPHKNQDLPIEHAQSQPFPDR